MVVTFIVVKIRGDCIFNKLNHSKLQQVVSDRGSFSADFFLFYEVRVCYTAKLENFMRNMGKIQIQFWNKRSGKCNCTKWISKKNKMTFLHLSIRLNSLWAEDNIVDFSCYVDFLSIFLLSIISQSKRNKYVNLVSALIGDFYYLCICYVSHHTCRLWIDLSLWRASITSYSSLCMGTNFFWPTYADSASTNVVTP